MYLVEYLHKYLGVETDPTKLELKHPKTCRSLYQNAKSDRWDVNENNFPGERPS